MRIFLQHMKVVALVCSFAISLLRVCGGRCGQCPEFGSHLPAASQLTLTGEALSVTISPSSGMLLRFIFIPAPCVSSAGPRESYGRGFRGRGQHDSRSSAGDRASSLKLLTQGDEFVGAFQQAGAAFHHGSYDEIKKAGNIPQEGAMQARCGTHRTPCATTACSSTTSTRAFSRTY